jgi:DNA polymerase V
VSNWWNRSNCKTAPHCGLRGNLAICDYRGANLDSRFEIKLILMPPSDHGGFRPNAGRKALYDEPSRQVRVPESQVETVVSFIAAYRSDTARATDPRPLASSPLPMQITAYLSRVPAGFPSPAQDYEEELDFNTHLIIQGHAEATFVLRVVGHSMIGCGIFDGDEIIVDRALKAKEGSVVVAVVNDEMTIKRLIFRKGLPVLMAENPHFSDRTFAEGEELSIWGVVTRVLHRV